MINVDQAFITSIMIFEFSQVNRDGSLSKDHLSVS
jgi:hypothetical protein